MQPLFGVPTSSLVIAFLFGAHSVLSHQLARLVNFWLIRPSRRSPLPPCPLPSCCVGGLSSCTTTVLARPLHCTRIDSGSPCLLARRPSSSLLSHQPLALPETNVYSLPAVLLAFFPCAHSAYANQERAQQFWSFQLVCCCWIAASLINFYQIPMRGTNCLFLHKF